MNVTSGENSAAANTVLRTPIPVPIVRLSDVPSEPIEEITTVTADVLADDDITEVTFIAGEQTVTLTDEPYEFSIDPIAFLPGDYSLIAAVEDENGDLGSADATFTVAALPSEVIISPDLTTLGEIDEETTITLDVSGQTPATNIEYSLMGPAFPDGQLLPLWHRQHHRSASAIPCCRRKSADTASYEPGRRHINNSTSIPRRRTSSSNHGERHSRWADH